jgi:hypothetical protein
MDDPELRNDEKVLARAHMVRIKSMLFEAVLTNKRIILMDKVKNLLPQKDIPLTTINDIKPGEDAIRDQIITLTILTNAGDKRKMVLTFSRDGGGNRKKERDEWIRLVHDQLSPSFVQVIHKVVPSRKPAPKVTEPTAAPKIEITGLPVTPAPALSLGSYCTRCGKRVPDGAAFCGYCGTKVTVPAGVPPAPVPQPPAELLSEKPVIRNSLEKVTGEPKGGVPSVPAARPPALQPKMPSPAAQVPAKPAGKRFISRLFSRKKVHPAPVAPGSLSTVTPQEPRRPKSKKKVLTVVGIIVIVLIVVAAAVFVVPKIVSGITSAQPASTTGTPVTTVPASAQTAVPEVTPASTVTLPSHQTPEIVVSKSCSDIGGVICRSDETCSGSMINTTDSSMCCAGICSVPSSSSGNTAP